MAWQPLTASSAASEPLLKRVAFRENANATAYAAVCCIWRSSHSRYL